MLPRDPISTRDYSPGFLFIEVGNLAELRIYWQ